MNRRTRGRALLATAVAAVAVATYGIVVATADDPPDDKLGETAEVDAQGESVEANDDGDVVKNEGETAELVDAESETAVFTLTVDDVQLLQTCPGRDDTEVTPERGHFVAFTVEATMAEEITEVADNDGEVFLPLLADVFTITDESGTEYWGGGSEAAWLCFEPDELAPAFVGPGESAAGLVVLDSSVEHGFIKYAPEGQAGWVWEF